VNGNPLNTIDRDGLIAKTYNVENSLKNIGALPSYSFNAMDHYELMIMVTVFPEIMVPMMMGKGVRPSAPLIKRLFHFKGVSF
jgi:hypothetical protein